MSNERKFQLFLLLLALGFLLYLLGNYNLAHPGLIVFIGFFGLIGILFYSHFEEPNNFFRYYPRHRKLNNYDKSLLFVFAKLMEVDGEVKESELRIAKKILKRELNSSYLKEHFEFLKCSFGQEANISNPLSDIVQNFGKHYGTVLINHLIRIAVADRFLSQKEEEFIVKASKIVGIGQPALEVLFSIHTYVKESESFRQQTTTNVVSTKLSNSFKILGVESTSTMEEIKDAYRDLAKIFHPDKVRKIDKNKEEATRQFQVIVEAYETIKQSKS